MPTTLRKRYERSQKNVPFQPTHLYIQPRPKPVEVQIREDMLCRKFIKCHPLDEEEPIGDLELACCCIPGPKKGHRQLAHYIPIMMLLNEFGMVNADFLSKTLGLSRDNAKQILKRLKDYGFIEPIIPGYYRVVAFETKMRVNKRTLPELEMEIEEFHRVQEKKVSEARLREKHMESMTMNEKFAAGLWGLDPWRDHRMPLDEAE